MAGTRSELCGGLVTARFLTPNDEGKWRYGEILADAAAKLMAAGPTLDPAWDPGGLPHNQASGAIRGDPDRLLDLRHEGIGARRWLEDLLHTTR
jgi:hypothetical protein